MATMTLSASNHDADLRSLPTAAPASASDADSRASTDSRNAETMAPAPVLADASEAGREAPEPHLQETLPPESALAPAAPAHAPAARSLSAHGSAHGRMPAPSRSGAPGDDSVEQHGLGSGVVVDDQYELIREVGRGGMGVVFLARDIRLGRLVAVKFVLVRNARVKKRFLAEARTTARCTHQNIVVLHEADEFNGLPYMVLEYLEGKTLRHLMDERAGLASPGGRQGDVGGLSVARTLEIMLPVLRALERAHGMGIVHRDLKPENVILTDSGVVKVLDFGIAKMVSMVADDEVAASAGRSFEQVSATQVSQTKGTKGTKGTKAGSLIGTLPYMSPEQLDAGVVDHQVDIWAAGIMLFEMIAGHHPMAPLSMIAFERIADVAIPMPRAGDVCAALGALGPVIDRCLLKDKADRIGSVGELIAELEPLVPGHRGMAQDEDVSPFAGLSAFQESDAERFFGRGEDTLAVVSRVREQPLVAVIGPSGAGKSSLVRAGVIPALKRSGEGWQSLIARPGRAPLLALAEIVERLELVSTTGARRRLATRPGAGSLARSATSSGEADGVAGRDAVVARLRAEPGFLGAALRAYAQRKLRRVLLFVDQFEEVYTLCADEEERAAFLGCLAGVADDAGSPLRVVLSMRADFLERLGENRSFMGLATRGLTLLPPMGRSGLRAALEEPLVALGYGFESEQTALDMLDGLEGTRGALPLLQFAATTLWKERDRGRRLLTSESYVAMGGIAGTLARHADSVVAAMTGERRKVARAVFERLVTPERTRAVVSVGELREIGGVDVDAVEEVLDELARARLVVVDTGSVEIVHESLIERWPMLRRWLDENEEDAALLARLRTAAREWDGSGEAEGMLWSGEAAAEARRWRDGYAGELSRLEGRFLDAVVVHAERSLRRRRRLSYAAVGALVLLVMAGGYAVIKGQNEAALERSLTIETAARKDAAEAQEEAVKQAQNAEDARARVQKLLKQTQDANAQVQRLLKQTQTDNERITTLLADARRQRKRAKQAEAEALREAGRARKAQEDEEMARRQAENAQEKAEELREKAEADKRKIAEQNQRIEALLGQIGTLKVDLKARQEQRKKGP